MSTQQPEPIPLEATYTLEGDTLTIVAAYNGATITVRLDWTNEDQDPAAGLGLLLPSLPTIIAQAHQEASRG